MGFFTWLKRETGIDLTTENIYRSVVKPVVNGVKSTVTAIMNDPLPYVAQIAGSFVGIPPYITASAVTAMRGGDINDIAKNAAVAYLGSQAFSATGIGQGIGETGASVNDFTSSLAQEYGLSASTANLLGTTAQSGFTNAARSGLQAIVSGGDIGDAISNSFLTGSVSSASNSYFGDINTQKDWGISPDTAKKIAGLASTTGTAVLTGGDAEQAINNYIASATRQTLNSELKSGANYLWAQAKEFATATTQAKSTYDETQAKYDKSAEELQAKIDAFNAERNSVEAQRQPFVDTYNTNLAEYNRQKAIYDDTNQSVDTRNAAADQMGVYAAEMQKAADSANALNPQMEALNKQAQEIQSAKLNLTDPSAGLAKDLKESADAVASTYEQYNKTLADAKVADEQYGKQVAEVATREALVDGVNNGTIKTVDNPDAPPGSIALENGIIITPDGKYLQNGKEVFANATGVNQGKIDFTTDSGDHFVFDETGRRLTSETDAQKVFQNEFGLTIDPEEAKKFAGAQYGQDDLEVMRAEANAKIAEQLKQYGYKTDQQTIDSFIEKGGDTFANLQKAVDPYYVAQDEVNQFFQQTIGRDATPEEIVQFVGAKNEASTFDQRQADELKRFGFFQDLLGDYAPKSMAYTPTDELGRQYIYKNADGSSSYYDASGTMHVIAAPEADDTLSEVTVTGQRETNPLLDLPLTPVNAPPPVAKATTTPAATPSLPITTTTNAPTTTAGFSPLSTESTATTAATPTPLQATFLKSTVQPNGMQNFLAPLHQAMAQPQSLEFLQDQSQQQAQTPQIQEQTDMLEPFYKYGTHQSIDDIMAGMENQPRMAAGGLTGTRHGRYAGGGMATPLMAAGGKLRVDFRHGDAVTGEGDGQSDDIPAMLADGEFVFPADVVAAIGNGSTKAGSDKLYDMMHSIRAHARSAKPEDLPPAIKSPLQFLNAKPKKARR